MDKKEYNKKYRKKTESRHRRYMRNYTRQNRERLKAQNIAREAIKAGFIEVQPCFKCGCEGKYGVTDGVRLFIYQEDYDNPLDMSFICIDCQYELRQQEREEIKKMEKELQEREGIQYGSTKNW